MQPPSRRFVLTGLASLAAVGCAGPTGLSVLAASSLAGVLPALLREVDVSARPQLAATSRLAAQVRAGSPGDVFWSADERWMATLLHEGHVDPDSVRRFLANQLVLAARVDGPLKTASDLRAHHRLGLADPSVPVGHYAEQALSEQPIAGTVLQGHSAGGLTAWLERGEVDAAFVYATDVAARPSLMALQRYDLPVSCPVAVLTTSRDPAAATAFIDHCATTGASRLRSAGFRLTGDPS